jgi:hypothetical protein
MSLILGILDSGGAAAGAANSYESIATVTVGSGGAATISFTSIPATYTHLQVRGIVRNDAGGGNTQNLNMTINNDTSSAYSLHQLDADGSSTSAYGENVNRSNCAQVMQLTTSTAGANIFGTGIIDILDYTNTNKNRTVRSLRGQDQNNTSGSLSFKSYLYTSTTAISRLDFISNGGNLVQYSQLALYGIKGS